MTTLNQARQAIEEAVTTAFPGYNIAYQNASFDPPANELWLRITTIPNDNENASIGGGVQRQHGLIYFNLFTPLHLGTYDLFTLADAVKAVFENKRINGVTFRTAKFSSPQEDDQWYHLPLNIPWYY